MHSIASAALAAVRSSSNAPTLAAAAAAARLARGPAVPAGVPAADGAPRRSFASGSLTDGKPKTVLAVLYSAGAAGRRQPKLLGCIENELGLRKWLEDQGHTFIVTNDKEPGGVADKHLPDADIVISTPFHPYYLNADRMAKAKNLKLSVTAGIGSDHVDLLAARDKGITVAEVTGSNVVSVAEHVVMMILSLVRNYIPAYTQVINDQWDVGEIAADAYDLENKVVGTVGCGRIGQRVLERLKPFNCKELVYYDYARLPEALEKQIGARYMALEDLVKACDVITINCPLHEKTKGLFNKALLSKMKKGAWLVNTARGAIVERDDLVEVMKSGHLAGYAGDVWYPQPAPADHPWRHMPRQSMTPHYSGTTLDAQARYAAGTKEIIRRCLAGEALIPTDVIVDKGVLAPQYDAQAKASARTLDLKETWEKVKN